MRKYSTFGVPGVAGGSPSVATPSSSFITCVALGGNVLPPSSVKGVKKVTSYITDIRLSTGPDVYPIPPARATINITLSGGSVTAVAVPGGSSGSAYKAVGSMSTSEKRILISGTGTITTPAVIEISATSSGAVTGYTIVNAGAGYTGIFGVVPDPTGDPLGLPWPDGIAYGRTSELGYVLILNDARSGIQHALEINRPFIYGSFATIQGRTLSLPWFI